MNPNDITLIREHCDYFKNVVLNLAEDGDGRSLHDIKNSFDYVITYVKEYGIDRTAFGEGVLEKAEQAGAILSQFYNSIEALDKSLRKFCDRQEEINNSVASLY